MGLNNVWGIYDTGGLKLGWGEGGGAGEGRKERRKGRRGKRSVRVRVAKGEMWNV